MPTTPNIFQEPCPISYMKYSEKMAPKQNWHVANAAEVFNFCLPTNINFGQHFHTTLCKDSFGFYVLFLEQRCKSGVSDMRGKMWTNISLLPVAGFHGLCGGLHSMILK